MSRDHVLFIIATVLMAAHVIYGTVQADTSLLFSFSLFVFPYLVLSAIWFSLKDIYKLSITIVLIILELNHTATTTIPNLMKNGFDTSTLNVIFYFPSIILLLTIFLLLVARRIGVKKDDNKYSST
ncbi:MAG: hypothetical protein AB2392_14185 [Neobacillus sp.]